MQIKFKGKYFDTQKDAVHVEDAYVQKMIDEVIEKLVKSRKKETDFTFSATGDTLVAGVKWEQDGEIEVMVTQNYNHACLLRDEYGNYQPVDWGEEERREELENMSKDELINEIYFLEKELSDWTPPQYNPRREV